MNPIANARPPSIADAPCGATTTRFPSTNLGEGRVAGAAEMALDDPRVMQAIEEYSAALREGNPPDRQAFLARYPEVAHIVASCLDSLQFICTAAPELHESDGDQMPAEASHLLTPLGDYQIIREVGRGGMGVVYEAEQMSLGRRVALKVLPFATAMDAKQLQRFKNEAQAAAHLHHTNIVPVFAVGCERGVHYYAMQFIEGETLAAMIAGLRQLEKKDISRRGEPRPVSDASQKREADQRFCEASLTNVDETKIETVAALSTAQSVRDPSFYRTVANLGIQAAEALEHAHSEGIIHRDIKPSNLLVDGKGVLWVTDFGLAQMQTGGNLTMTGDLLGTLRYMSPEQALAKRVIVDHRTDIYSLGVTLYELLTLEPAIAGQDRQEMLRRIAFEEPKPPRRLNNSIPAELETIVLKAMAKVPDERYATAQEVADDLRRWLEHKPIRAKRPSLLQRARKWLRRHELVVVSTAAAGILGLAATAFVFGRGYLREQKRAAEVEEAYEIGILARNDLALTAFSLRRDLAERQTRFGTLQEISELLVRYTDNWRRDGVRAIRIGFGWGAEVRFTPDGRHIVNPERNEVVFRDANTGQPVFRIPVLSGGRIAISADGRWLAAGHLDLHLWDLSSRTLVRQLRQPHGQSGHDFTYYQGVHRTFYDIAFSSDPYNPRLASAGFDGKLKIWNVATFELERSLEGFFALAFSPAGTEIATAVEMKKTPVHASEVVVYDLATGKEKKVLQTHIGSIGSIAYSPDGRDIASAGLNSVYVPSGELVTGQIRIMNANTGGNKRVLQGHSDAVMRLAYSHDGRYLASASLDGTVRVWDPSTGKEVAVLRGHLCPVYSVCFSPDGCRLVSAGGRYQKEGEMRIWERKWWEPEKSEVRSQKPE